MPPELSTVNYISYLCVFLEISGSELQNVLFEASPTRRRRRRRRTDGRMDGEIIHSEVSPLERRQENQAKQEAHVLKLMQAKARKRGDIEAR